MFPGGNKKHFVVRLDHRPTLGNDGLTAAPENRRDPGVHPRHVLANLLQFPPDNGPTCDRFHGNQPNAALSKIEHLQ